LVKDDDEDKNLGRWVNRQRSLYQSGKLRKDRQLALEKIGLKWSMLATTPWDSMFETLEEYVKEKTRNGAKWDGNVPANYKTNHDPPRALGRWINRQRSAYGKKKLKREYESKLQDIGLKWSVHERKFNYDYPVKTTPDGVGSTCTGESTHQVQTTDLPDTNAECAIQYSEQEPDDPVPDNSMSTEPASAEVTQPTEVNPECCVDSAVDLEVSEEEKDAAESQEV
jgi:hypothetical protein